MGLIFLDTKNTIPEYGLQFLRYFLDIEVEGNPHNAKTDVKILSAIFDRLFLKMKESFGKDSDVIEKVIKISKT